ncbi:anti-sigma factor [Hugenholtzia roseola]|uniref:anti-sigma factor n=1 Tax=Hugenholtzia roseola TaxID=1002 RepID=UPI0012B5956A|nr:hypothetical protein [Hugenholtzia roseola]
MNKKYSDDLIIKYLENQLSPKERLQFEADLAQDAELARELEEFQMLGKLLRESAEREMLRNKAFHIKDNEQVSEERRKRREALQRGLANLRAQHQPQTHTNEKKNEPMLFKTYQMLAASVMLLTIGGGVFLSYQHLKTNQVQAIAHIEPAIPEAKYANLQIDSAEPITEQNYYQEEQLALESEAQNSIQEDLKNELKNGEENRKENEQNNKKEDGETAFAYTELPDLEALIQQGHYRSSIHLISPKTESNYQNGILFSWRGELDEEEEEFYLELYSAALDKPLRLDIPRQNQTFKLDRKLTPQLYYWKLQTENDLIAVGKFKVEAK